MHKSELSRNALDRLLAVLDPDRERAGEAYEKLRRKLVRLFEGRCHLLPEELADETIDRVATKLLDDFEVRDVVAYALGVARYVMMESRHVDNHAPIDDLRSPRVPAADPQREESRRTEKLAVENRLECLEKCLENLLPSQRGLVIEYYQKTRSEKIIQRRQMAESLGIKLDALRVQAHRIRAKLEECVMRCLRRPEGSACSCNGM